MEVKIWPYSTSIETAISKFQVTANSVPAVKKPLLVAEFRKKPDSKNNVIFVKNLFHIFHNYILACRT